LAIIADKKKRHLWVCHCIFLYLDNFWIFCSYSKKGRIKRTRRTGAEKVNMPLKRGNRAEQLNVQHKGAKGGTLCTEKEIVSFLWNDYMKYCNFINFVLTL
jgi:hypothetical protein